MVQVGAVGDNDDAGIDDVPVEGECAAEHDHGEGFAGALGVPDYAALASAGGVDVFDAFHGSPDGEVLLVAGDLAGAGVEYGEAADEVEETVGAAEGVEGVGSADGFRLRLAPAVPELLWGADGRVACLFAVEGEEELGEVEEVGDVVSALVGD